METFSELIDLWPTAEALGQDIGESGVNVRAWRRRNAVPPEHWGRIIVSAATRGIAGVTAELLVALAEKPPNGSRGAAA